MVDALNDRVCKFHIHNYNIDVIIFTVKII
jgi:hypothetical protein